MNTSSAESRDRLRQSIDDEVNSLEESVRALKSRRNALAPISRLPPETLAAIFSFASHSQWDAKAGHLTRICVTRVCRRWRETALDHSRLWSHINLTGLTRAGVAEILARAKMAPLHLEVHTDSTKWSVAQIAAIERQLEAHISRTRHLVISGLVERVLKGLVLPAPILESLSLSASSLADIPINLFNCTTPSLRNLELRSCDISWKSPLLKGLRTLKMLTPAGTRPQLEDWLSALSEMPQLETLLLQFATPVASMATPLISEPSRTVTLPSLTKFFISASAKDCALALAHLVLPALTRIQVNAASHDQEGEDVHQLIPYVARNVYDLQSTKPIRSVLINGEIARAEVIASTTPDVEVSDPNIFFHDSVHACLIFIATGHIWNYGVDAVVSDTLLTFLPVNSISTFTAQNNTWLDKKFWLNHAPRLLLLERVRLVPTAFKTFRDILAEDAPPDGPRLPSLKNLILVDFTLTEHRAYHLCDMLIERVEQGVPLEVLDLRTCAAADRELQLLTEIVVDVQEPLARFMDVKEPAFFRFGYEDERNSWYYDTEEEDDEEEDESGYDDELVDYDDETIEEMIL